MLIKYSMQTCKREPAHFYRRTYQWASLWLHSRGTQGRVVSITSKANNKM